ncbi:hypothetical protein J1N35_012917 [Gossypium stocksii]|uniref:Agglutinin domain-containing protein n=1 Tax=Gossypium stocksii TaxID=47602 RepID=A0A9D3VT02_9ROSI|nr:hypothetical protein J1N35_012917 [Gossypium stocksii]
MAIAWPRFMVLKCEARNKYLRYMHESYDCHGYLRFSETLACSPYTKFEVERAKCSGEDGLVHIKSCHNNRYCKRVKNVSITGKSEEQYWISAAADKPEDGQSEESCTLFKLIPVDTATNKIRLMHVQSGCYLCLWWVDSPTFNNCVLANYKVFDGNSCDLFTVIDWELLANKPFASPRITTTTKKPEEDRSKKSYTLFKLISVDDAANEVQIVHVQSRKYLWVIRETPHLFTSEHLDEYFRDMFTIIDWESLVFLPRHVAFKGNNDQYLCLRQIEGHPYL